MSENNSKVELKTDKSDKGITWHWWIAIIIVVLVYLLAQYIGAQLAIIYPYLKHWSGARTTSWLNNSVIAQFVYVVLAEGFTLLLLWLFIKWRKGTLKAIGLVKPKWEDIAYALSGLVIYFPIYILVVGILEHIINLNVTQQQQIGFGTNTSGWQLSLVFISLVILPPIAEEIMFRGFLYSSLKKELPKIIAVLLTCLIFASPHLLESSSGGLLWIAGIDTFILSLVLVWLREKTGRLYAGMGLHALKNFIAFASLFLLHAH